VQVRQQQIGREVELFRLKIKTQPFLLAQQPQAVEIHAASTLLA
jgi:hypothetical protein